jgi:HAD superfamily hydrolase (TIGR01509 family)
VAGRVAAVVFDMDGLMLDTELLYKAAWQEAAAELGYALDDATYCRFIGRTTDDAERELARHFGPTFPGDRFHERWPAAWRHHAEGGIPTKPGLPELLAYLDDAGIPFAVATSSDADYAEFSLERAGLAARIGIIVTADDVALGKPAPDLYLEAARRLAVPPSTCVALEDSDAGVISAHHATMLTLMIPDLKPPSDEAAALAFRILGSLHEARGVLADLVARPAR